MNQPPAGDGGLADDPLTIRGWLLLGNDGMAVGYAATLADRCLHLSRPAEPFAPTAYGGIKLYDAAAETQPDGLTPFSYFILPLDEVMASIGATISTEVIVDTEPGQDSKLTWHLGPRDVLGQARLDSGARPPSGRSAGDSGMRAFARTLMPDIIDRHNQRWLAGHRQGQDFDIRVLLLASGYPASDDTATEGGST